MPPPRSDSPVCYSVFSLPCPQRSGTASHGSWTIKDIRVDVCYSRVEDLRDQDVVVVEVLSLPEELLFVVLVADVRELGRGSSVYGCFHVDDVADMSFVVLVISI